MFETMETLTKTSFATEDKEAMSKLCRKMLTPGAHTHTFCSVQYFFTVVLATFHGCQGAIGD